MKERRNCVTRCLLICVACAGFLWPVEGGAGGKAELKNLGNGICQQKNGLMWQISKSGTIATGEQAQDYVETLNLGDYSDWRLPTKDELYDLCDIYELKLQGDCPIKIKGDYWSQNGKVQPGEWEAYPLCGGSEYKYLKKNKGRVRAVRP